VVVQRDPDVLELDPFFGAFIGGVEAYLDERDYALVLQMSSSAEQTLSRYRRLAADRRVDGVFLNELEVDDPRIDLVQDLGLPAVAINPGAGCPVPAVRQGYTTALRELMAHFAATGHERVAHVSGPLNYLHAVQRVQAWRSALAEFGLEEGVLVSGEFTYEGGAAAADAIAADAASTAVFCANDLSAMGLVARLARADIAVPARVSVAGFDGIQLGEYVHPSLTTIRTSPRRIGYEAARVLLTAIEGGAAEDAEVPPAELVLRESTRRTSDR
jgi:Transcriptional regulators